MNNTIFSCSLQLLCPYEPLIRAHGGSVGRHVAHCPDADSNATALANKIKNVLLYSRRRCRVLSSADRPLAPCSLLQQHYCLLASPTLAIKGLQPQRLAGLASARYHGVMRLSNCLFCWYMGHFRASKGKGNIRTVRFGNTEGRVTAGRRARGNGCDGYHQDMADKKTTLTLSLYLPGHSVLQSVPLANALLPSLPYMRPFNYIARVLPRPQSPYPLHTGQSATANRPYVAVPNPVPRRHAFTWK